MSGREGAWNDVAENTTNYQASTTVFEEERVPQQGKPKNPIDQPPAEKHRQQYAPSGFIPGPRDGEVVPAGSSSGKRLFVAQPPALPPAVNDSKIKTASDVVTKANYVGQGQAFGIGISGAQYAADQVMRRIESGESVWTQRLRSAISPNYHKLLQTDAIYQTASLNHGMLNSSYKLAELGLDSACERVTTIFEKVDLNSAAEKLQKLNRICPKLQTADDVVAHFSKNGIYTKAELVAVREYAESFFTWSGQKKLLIDAENEMGKAKMLLDKVERNTSLSAKGAVFALGKGLVVGTLVTGGELSARYALDMVTGRNRTEDASWSWGISNVTVPGILVSPLSPKKKIAATTLSIIGSASMDYCFDPPKGRIRDVFRPNIADAGLGVMAGLAPGSWKKKLGMFALAGVGGRAYGLAFGTEAPAEKRAAALEDALEKFSNHKNKRTYAAFEEAVTTGSKLATSNERALVKHLKDTLTENHFPFLKEFDSKSACIEHWKESMEASGKDSLSAFLASASAYASLAEFRLRSGSRLRTNESKPGAGVRIMEHCNYDLGCEAYTCMNKAGLFMWEARNEAQKRKASESEIAELTKQLDHINQRLQQFTGAHDMEKAFRELTDSAIPLKFSYLSGFGPEFKATIDHLRTNDTRYHAKMCRDYALYCMAWSKFMVDRNNYGDGQVMLKDGLKYLQQANQLDPNGADTRWLIQKAPELATRAGVTIPKGFFTPAKK